MKVLLSLSQCLLSGLIIFCINLPNLADLSFHCWTWGCGWWYWSGISNSLCGFKEIHLNSVEVVGACSSRGLPPKLFAKNILELTAVPCIFIIYQWLHFVLLTKTSLYNIDFWNFDFKFDHHLYYDFEIFTLSFKLTFVFLRTFC